MIDVAITLDFHGLGEERSELCRIVIWNTGEGSHHFGTYEYVISHQEGTQYAPSAYVPDARSLLNDPAWWWKRGRLENFPRSLGAAILLAKVMRDAFPRESRS